ncbi:MAG: DNA translocase FtsK 4TM domain-containing protein, partial [Bacteroidota bacterium]
MAENTFRSNTPREPAEKEKEKKKRKSKSRFEFTFFKDPRFALASGFLLIGIALFLFVSFLSYLFTGEADQSVVKAMGDVEMMESGAEAANWAGLWGAVTAHFLVMQWLGVAAFFIPPILFILGFRLTFKRELLPAFPTFVFSVFTGIWLSLLLGYITHSINGYTGLGLYSGGLGFELARIADGLLGLGTFLFLILSLTIFIIYFFNVTVIDLFTVKNPKPMGNDAILPTPEPDSGYTDDRDTWTAQPEPVVEAEAAPAGVPIDLTDPVPSTPAAADLTAEKPEKESKTPKEPIFTVEQPKEDTEELAEQLVEQQGLYDPTLDLGSYKFPPLELLNEYEQGKVQVTQDELTQNKDKISNTLNNFKIGIQSIKATIGPTVTLYEIVPEAGIKISRIKNLEDDIALSLAALGIRIIAPIPGKGTIGIEVPNKNREMVSIRSVLSTLAFQKTEKELPVALGKTIQNEVLVIDLAKMPHLLVAGATGQGKSVGLNVILTSLLYKRHPSQLKFVLVDPKKVEMSLFSKIERHYLAKLPNSEEAIITDTRKVVHTLNSLCIEMENRYEILKEAGAKNLKEYNAKFVARKLNPKEGHRFLPYIVLVIDELADLMMTAGKEVETPIARLAQLARAIGI